VAVDALLPLQTAIYGALTGDVPLMAAIDAVHDYVPHESTYPYVTLGNDDYEWWGAMQLDGGHYLVQIDTWSRAQGRSECKTIMGLIATVLHDVALTVVGNTHISTRIDFQSCMPEEDGLTHHGVQRFKVLLHE